MNHLIYLVLAHPWASKGLGSIFLSFGLLMATLGLRFGALGRRITRAFVGVGADSPDILHGFPWWLGILVPDAPIDWVFVALLMASGTYFLHLSKRATKQRN
jgi:hypothetical protein